MTQEAKPLTGTVLEIQRMSTEDGPGIRTTVFFKGCTLKCAWCHNPESISPKPQLQWVESRCIGCKTCLEVCPEGALTFLPEGLQIDRDKCTGCGICAEECPSTAMELMGKAWTVDDLVNEVAKDKAYFETSGGGVTASGGEACMQADFVAAFLAECRERGISTALDTCGQCSGESLKKILPHTDMVLFDLKEADPEKHREFTGHAYDLIRENLVMLRDFIRAHDTPRELWIRTPIIPGATDREDNMRGLGEFIAQNLNGIVSRWELCSFNNLCRDKYLRLGLLWPYHDAQLMRADDMERLAEAARQSGVDPEIVYWSGATRLEKNDEPEKDDTQHLRLVKSCPA
jgi:pyruvate formate lyase activating enzyme